MSYISPKFAVGDTVYNYEPEIDALYRGVVLGIQATSSDASRYAGTWVFVYEVQFHRGTDLVPEQHLSVRAEFPELVSPATKPEPTPEPVPAIQP